MSGPALWLVQQAARLLYVGSYFLILSPQAFLT